uniref:hypothetical protein n=1 Tax=uncultured Draconibacterium sp. TaxID=1573823 RepID=UPI00321635DE
MKNILFIATICLLLLNQTIASAQPQGNKSPQNRWEKYRAEKVAFLTTNLDLSPEEAQKFWPVYNQMDKEKSEAQKKRHELEQKVREAGETLSDEEIIKLTRQFASNMEKEGALSSKYNEEFLKILPPQKVLELYKVEGEFRMHMFKKFRDQRRKENEHP